MNDWKDNWFAQDLPDRSIDPPEPDDMPTTLTGREQDPDEAYEIERQRKLDELVWAREELDKKIEAHKSEMIKANAKEIADSVMDCLRDIGGRK